MQELLVLLYLMRYAAIMTSMLALHFPTRWCNVSFSEHEVAGRGGLVVGRPTAVRENLGSNLTAAGRVYHDSHCYI